MSKYRDAFGISEIWMNQVSNKTIYIAVPSILWLKIVKSFFWGNYLLDLCTQGAFTYEVRFLGMLVA